MVALLRAVAHEWSSGGRPRGTNAMPRFDDWCGKRQKISSPFLLNIGRPRLRLVANRANRRRRRARKGAVVITVASSYGCYRRRQGPNPPRGRNARTDEGNGRDVGRGAPHCGHGERRCRRRLRLGEGRLSQFAGAALLLPDRAHEDVLPQASHQRRTPGACRRWVQAHRRVGRLVGSPQRFPQDGKGCFDLPDAALSDFCAPPLNSAASRQTHRRLLRKRDNGDSRLLR
jgi:hypothetical protein